MVEDISENLKKLSFKKFSFFDQPIDAFFDKKLKKIINEEKFLEDYKRTDIFLIGFKKGEKVFFKKFNQKTFSCKKTKTNFFDRRCTARKY